MATSTTEPSAPSYPTGVQLTVFDPAFREDPYPILAETREKAPIHYNEELGSWVFTRHADVSAILRNPDHWSDPRRASPDSFYFKALGGASGEEPSMLMMDDPGHRRLRQLVKHPFTPRAIERWRERARAVARRHVDAIEGDDFDLIETVANPIPTVVIAELLGLDPERHADFKRWSDAVIKTAFTPFGTEAEIAAAEAAGLKLWAFFQDEVRKRRAAPTDDLISAMIHAEEAGDQLSDEEIIRQCNLLLLAGNLTTSDLIGNAVMALVRHPEQQQLLREDRSLLKNAVEEVLRYDSPVTNSGRIAHEDFEIGGFAIRQGQALSVSLAAGNRDPRGASGAGPLRHPAREDPAPLLRRRPPLLPGCAPGAARSGRDPRRAARPLLPSGTGRRPLRVRRELELPRPRAPAAPRLPRLATPMRYEDREWILDPKRLPFESGVERLPDGVMHVAVLTRMPEVRAEMIGWWFGSYMQTTEHYRRWHPRDHHWMDWEDKQPGTHVGAHHLVHETIGGQMQKLRISFVDPVEEMGPRAVEAGRLTVCALPGLLDRPVKLGRMVHAASDTAWGCELRSHFWLGIVQSEFAGGLVQALGNQPWVRRRTASFRAAQALQAHCQEEMTTLAGFLPELYASEGPG